MKKAFLVFIIYILMFSRIVFSTGFHTPDEILPGTFTGTYFYNGTLSVTDNSQLCLNNECINNWSIISGASGMGIKGYFDYDGTYLKPNLTTGSYILNINAPGIFAGSNPYDLTPSDGVVHVLGDVHATGELIADGADLAEKYLSDSNEEFSAGDVVVISKTQDDSIEKSTYSYQKVLGVISTKPGLVINGNEENGHLVALVGKVPTKVIVDESNPIKRGDRLVASDIKGHAKKCELINPSQSSLPIEEVIYNNQLCIDGTIGYALQQTDKTGKILIVLK